MNTADSSHSASATNPCRKKLLGFVLPLVGFLLFTIFTIMFVLQFNHLPGPETKREEERRDILKKLREEEAARSTGYGFADTTKTKFYLPINRGMELAVQELQKKSVSEAYPIVLPQGAPVVVPVGTAKLGAPATPAPVVNKPK